MSPAARISTRTRNRRLLILGGVILAIGMLGVALFVAKEWRFQAWVDAERAEGFRLLEEGDPAAALQHLARVFRERPEDREAILAFAEAREAVPADDGGHLLATINIRSRLVELDPDDLEARRELMRLYVMVGFASEADREADEVIRLAGDDPDALAVKLSVASSRGRSAEAERIAARLVEDSNANFDALRARLSLLFEQDLSPDDVLRRVQAWAVPPTLEAGRRTILAELELRQGRLEEALATARQAAGMRPTDPETVAALVDVLDRAGDAEAASALIDQVLPIGKNQETLFDLGIRREWRAGRLDEASDFLRRGEDLLGRNAEPVLRWRIRLAASGRDEPLLAVSSGQYRESFAGMPPLDRRAASTWLEAMLLAADPTTTGASLRDALDAAIEANTADSLLRVLRGRLLLLSGRPREAIADFGIAMRVENGAHVNAGLLLAAALEASGQPGRGLEVASELLGRYGDQLAVITTFASIWDTFDRTGRPLEDLRLATIPTMELLPFLEMVFQRTEGDPRIASLLAAAAARLGDADRLEQALAILDSPNPVPVPIAVRLAVLAVENDSPRAETALRRLEAADPGSIEIPRLRAVALGKAGRPEEAFADYQSALDAAGDRLSPIERVSRLAAFASRFSLPNAAALEQRRIEVLQQQGGSAVALLAAPATWADESTARAVVDRAREELSANHPEVLKAEARWISDFRPDEEVRRRPVVAALVAEMERGSEDPQLPLVLARLVATGERPDEALIERALRRRLELAPDDLQPYADLARLLLSNNQSGAAAELADELLARSVASPDGRRQAAVILQAAGRRPRAIEVMRELAGRDELEADVVMLATLLREGEDPDEEAEAGRLLEAVAGRPEAGVEAVMAMADWEIANGRAEDALARVNERHAARGDLDLPVLAVRLWLAADQPARAEPAADALRASGRTDTAASVTLADWLVARSRIDEAVALVRERLLADPNQPALLVWAADRSSHPGWRYDEAPALRDAIGGAAPGLLAVSELQRDATRDDGRLEATPELLERSLVLVETYPRLPGAWRAAVVLHNVAGRTGAAIDLARRGTAENPRSVLLHQVLAELLIQSGRAADARLALDTLATLPDRDARTLTILEGEVALALGDPRAAMALAESLAADDPDGILLRAAASLDLGDTTSAITLLGNELQQLAALGIGRIPTMTAQAAAALVAALEPLRAGNLGLSIDLASGLLQCHGRTNDSALLDLADRLLEETSPGQPTSLLLRGDVLAARGAPGEAIERYREALEAIPAADRAALQRWPTLPGEERNRLASSRVLMASALNNMAYRRCEVGDVTDEHLGWIEQALILLPDNAALRDTRALVLLELDRIPEARADAEAAAIALPDDPTVRLTLARVLQRSQAYAAARGEVAAGLAILDRDPEGRPQLRKKFEQLDRSLQRAVMPSQGDRPVLPGYLDGGGR